MLLRRRSVCGAIYMARIRGVRDVSCFRVCVTGRLTATDMGRFERACAPALTTPVPALEIDLRRITDADGIAKAVLKRMADRGARIIWPIDAVGWGDTREANRSRSTRDNGERPRRSQTST